MAALWQGIAQGAHQKALETAKAFRDIGTDIAQIAQATGLSVKDIESL